MKYVLPVGTKIVFPDTPSNRKILLCGEGYEDVYNGFNLGTVYEVAGMDGGSCYFYDGACDKNYAGFDVDGSDGVFEIMC